MEKLIKKLRDQNVLKTKKIIDALRSIDRKDFVLTTEQEYAYEDCPLTLGYGATISQPTTVVFMLEELEPEEGQNVLDIGSGSGWVSCLLAKIVGSKGKVFAMEHVPELVEFSKKNSEKYNFHHLQFICGDGTKGLLSKSPFDRIHVAAAAQTIPEELKKQLKVGGIMLIPTADNTISKIIKKDETTFNETIYEGFVFVPLIHAI